MRELILLLSHTTTTIQNGFQCCGARMFFRWHSDVTMFCSNFVCFLFNENFQLKIIRDSNQERKIFLDYSTGQILNFNFALVCCQIFAIDDFSKTITRCLAPKQRNCVFTSLQLVLYFLVSLINGTTSPESLNNV